MFYPDLRRPLAIRFHPIPILRSFRRFFLGIESPIGFEVETLGVDVVDLATAFGVAVGMDGETDVCVFQGEVEVSPVGLDADAEAQLLQAGNAVRSTPQSVKIESVVDETDRFQEGRPVTSGVLQATGLMKFVALGPGFVPGKYEDNDRIVVYAERQEVLLKSKLRVDLTASGCCQRINRQAEKLVPAGIRVRSYLLNLVPLGRMELNSSWMHGT